MERIRLTGALAACLLLLTALTTTAHATLIGRLPATMGGTDYQAYYDDVLDITWIANANLAASNTFGLAYNTNLGDYPGDPFGPSYTEQILTSGQMTWGGALHWIDAMNADGGTGYLGYNDWRLPIMLDTGTSGCNFAYTGTDCGYNIQTGSVATTVYSEMASLWYDTLGNKAFFDTSGTVQPGWGLTNTGPFSNVQSYVYWLGQGYASPGNNFAWAFTASNGSQGPNGKTENFYGWAVRSGDVSAVPVPAALWLFGSGLAGLLGVAGCKLWSAG